MRLVCQIAFPILMHTKFEGLCSRDSYCKLFFNLYVKLHGSQNKYASESSGRFIKPDC